jgi:Tc toxin complex TcA C-terminal TcB-binding domain
LQQGRAQKQWDQYNNLIVSGISPLEIAALSLRGAQAAVEAAATIYDFIKVDPGSGLSATASALGTTAGILETDASYERRAQGWQDQRDLAQQDVLIGQQQVSNAYLQVQITTQEQNVASIQDGNAQATVDYLANKFTNVELYDFMSGELERVYSYFLREATAIARLAQNQLAFERQEVPPPFIQADYWQAPSDTATTTSGDGTVDRRGLTGSARLLQDIYQLDEYAMQTNQRKLQLTRTFSLATLFPIEFALFQECGQLPFTTTLDLFDREFPGHYLRLIRRVRSTVVALVPASLGIRATLATTGTSRVVVAGDLFQTVVLRRDPQSTSYTSPRDATGVFDLDPQSELLLPFEGTGVAADWLFKMPRAANGFDYRTLADVLITFEYSALNSYDYRQQVLRAMSRDVSTDRGFSFVNNLADAWYDLHNPDQTATPMSVTFRTESDDFPPNVNDVLIQHLALLVLRADGMTFELPVS